MGKHMIWKYNNFPSPFSFLFYPLLRLRNGVKFCKMQSLPEVKGQIFTSDVSPRRSYLNISNKSCAFPLLQILCVHLKRFRHELMFSTKICTHVSFPLEGLDLQPFLAKDSSAQTTNYDLLSVICHHGTASSEWAQSLPFPLRPRRLAFSWQERPSRIHQPVDKCIMYLLGV